MIENFLFDAIENLYLIFIVLSVNGSYDPRNAWLKMKIDWTSAWVNCAGGNAATIFSFFIFISLIYRCEAAHQMANGVAMLLWQTYALQRYWLCLDGNNEKSMATQRTLIAPYAVHWNGMSATPKKMHAHTQHSDEWMENYVIQMMCRTGRPAFLHNTDRQIFLEWERESEWRANFST